MVKIKNKTNVAYILSMKRTGLDAFNYREMRELINHGLNISIFPTKYNVGPYMPEEEWDCYIYNPIKVVLKQPFFFLNNPKQYLRLLCESFKTKSLIDFLIANEFANQMKRRNIQHIHCHFGDHKLFIGYYCKRHLNIPLTVTIHAHELYNNPNEIMFKLSLNSCDKIITISNYNKKYIVENFGINTDRIIVIRLFVDTDVKATKKILTVGRFVEKKGHEILFTAIKKLNRADLKLWIVGGNGLDLEQLAIDLGIRDKIIFFGVVSDEILKELYERCGIFCLPSRTASDGDREGIPVALMEAMSYGKPVISTRHAGIPELVEDILVEENNAEELAKAIELLADNPDLRRKLGERNRKIIEERYSKKNVMKLANIMLE